MDKLSGKLFVLLLSGMAVYLVILLAPSFSGALRPDVPEADAVFDCDDGTLYMYRHFTSLGYESIPVIGNLETTGEKITEVNHAWLMVKIDGHYLAFDWGEPRYDKQHYEYYPIDHYDLEWLVEADTAASESVNSLIARIARKYS
jgi:hypothetical protein